MSHYSLVPIIYFRCFRQRNCICFVLSVCLSIAFSPSALRAQAGQPPNVPNRCVLNTFMVPNNLSACGDHDMDGWAGRQFTMDATFGDVTGCCEYRQSVMGRFTRANGTVIRHPLPTGDLSATMFREDGVTQGGVVINYGHRTQAGFDNGQFSRDRYTPAPRGTGTTYAGGDYPAIRAAGGTINVTFLGEIIDRCNGNRQVRMNQWTVNCTHPGPPPAGAPASTCTPALSADATTQLAGLPIAITLIVCQESENVLNVGVAITNGMGEQPIDASEIQLRISDTSGSFLSVLSSPSGTLPGTRLIGENDIADYTLVLPTGDAELYLTLNFRGDGVQELMFLAPI